MAGEDVLGASDVGGGTTTLVAEGAILLEDEHAAMKAASAVTPAGTQSFLIIPISLDVNSTRVDGALEMVRSGCTRL